MGCRTYGLSDLWAVGLMGCRTCEATPLINTDINSQNQKETRGEIDWDLCFICQGEGTNKNPLRYPIKN